jgi:hypothetical protein
MDRKETTAHLTELLEKHINPHKDTRIYSAREVTFDYSSLHPIRVDYMVFKPADQTTGGIEKGNFYCYEIKSCQADFNSGHGLNFIGDFNYLVIPQGLYMEIEKSIPYYVGVYEENSGELKCVKKAKQRNRGRSVSEMLLMMYRSSNRDLINIEKDKRKESYIEEEFSVEPLKGMNDYKCGYCGKYSVASHRPKFCSHCGAKYKEKTAYTKFD